MADNFGMNPLAPDFDEQRRQEQRLKVLRAMLANQPQVSAQTYGPLNAIAQVLSSGVLAHKEKKFDATALEAQANYRKNAAAANADLTKNWDNKEAILAAMQNPYVGEVATARARDFKIQDQYEDLGVDPSTGASRQRNKATNKIEYGPKPKDDGGAGSGPNAGVKLKPGERFKADNSGDVEAIPGSDLFKKQSDAHAKDAGALDTVTTQTDNATRKIDTILSPANKEGFEAMFGGYNAKAITQFAPGVTQDVKKEIESLKSDLKKAGLDMLRSGGSVGQMTVQEWPIVESAIEAIDPLLGEETARDKLNYVKAYLQRIRENAANLYEREWGGSQFHKGAKPVGGAGGKGGAPAMTFATEAEAEAAAAAGKIKPGDKITVGGKRATWQ